jgi:hypothetical protein
MSLDDWFSVQKSRMYADESVLLSPCSECWALVRVDDAELHQRWHEQLAAHLAEQ